MSGLVLVTGATGKVGRAFVDRLLGDRAWDGWRVRALCHNRVVPTGPRVEVERGSITEREVVRRAMRGVSHVMHLSTCKETPDDAMDVAVKGLFWVLEECRVSADFRRFVLMSGDASVGHFVYPQPIPVTETAPHTAYEGCYALSKVLEETMLQQYYVQYGLEGCCLRAPWIMEKDDFRYSQSFGDDVFGGPRWRDLVGAEKADQYVRDGVVPVMLDPDGKPVKRNFIHLDDLVEAMLVSLTHPKASRQMFNVCMDEPVDYRVVAEHLARTRGIRSVDVRTPYHSTWLDNAKARFLLGWRPRYDTARLVDAAWDYKRAADDPRKIWYPG